MVSQQPCKEINTVSKWKIIHPTLNQMLKHFPKFPHKALHCGDLVFIKILPSAYNMTCKNNEGKTGKTKSKGVIYCLHRIKKREMSTGFLQHFKSVASYKACWMAFSANQRRLASGDSVSEGSGLVWLVCWAIRGCCSCWWGRMEHRFYVIVSVRIDPDGYRNPTSTSLYPRTSGRQI